MSGIGFFAVLVIIANVPLLKRRLARSQQFGRGRYESSIGIPRPMPVIVEVSAKRPYARDDATVAIKVVVNHPLIAIVAFVG